MTDEQRERYSRHIMLTEMGEEGQERLLGSRVLIVGAGGLGSPVALYLAAAGVGTIAIADGDTVSLSNLQRQVIHTTADVGRMKVDSAADKMRAMNPDVRVLAHPHFVADSDVDALVAGCDLVIEATDNAASRYRVADACHRHSIPYIIGGVGCYGGQVMTCTPDACGYRDAFADEPAVAHTPQPILGPVVGMLGTIMATEAVKVLAAVGQPLVNRLLTFDARTMDFRVFDIKSPNRK